MIIYITIIHPKHGDRNSGYGKATSDYNSNKIMKGLCAMENHSADLAVQ